MALSAINKLLCAKFFLFEKKCGKKLLTNVKNGCIICAMKTKSRPKGGKIYGGAEYGNQEAPKENGDPRG